MTGVLRRSIVIACGLALQALPEGALASAACTSEEVERVQAYRDRAAEQLFRQVAQGRWQFDGYPRDFRRLAESLSPSCRRAIETTRGLPYVSATDTPPTESGKTPRPPVP